MISTGVNNKRRQVFTMSLAFIINFIQRLSDARAADDCRYNYRHNNCTNSNCSKLKSDGYAA